MTFQELHIEVERYGADKGKLKAKIKLNGRDTQVAMELPPDVGDKVLRLAKSAIIDAVEKTANDFLFELTTGIPDTLNLKAP